MLRNLITAVAGKKVAQKLSGGTAGTIAAAALPFVARRGLGPLSAALTAGWAVKKGLEWRRRKRLEQQVYPKTATPVVPPA